MTVRILDEKEQKTLYDVLVNLYEAHKLLKATYQPNVYESWSEMCARLTINELDGRGFKRSPNDKDDK